MVERTGDNGEKLIIPPSEVVLTSRDMIYGQLVIQELEVAGTRILLEGLSRIGSSYTGVKKASEDGCVVIRDKACLQMVVVDGGTQIERVPSLEVLGLSGGKYISEKIEEYGRNVPASISVVRNLHAINRAIGTDIRAHHPEVTFQEDSYNVPYGSIAGVRIATAAQVLEVANAGDVYVVAEHRNGEVTMLSVDDVYWKDQQTFATTEKLARIYGLSFREAMQGRNNDTRLHPIVQEMQETMRLGNIGRIRRITGAPNFDVTSSMIIDLSDVASVYIFTDGALIPGVNIQSKEGLREFMDFIEHFRLEDLDLEITKRHSEDQAFEKYPRFGLIDDLMILKLGISQN